MGDSAWLVRTSGPHVGKRELVTGDRVLVGRDPAAEVTPSGDECAYVSGRHAEIECTADGFRLTDLGSTNGTFVNGQQVVEAELRDGDTVRFGASGPEYRLSVNVEHDDDLAATIVAPAVKEPGAADEESDTSREQALSDAVEQARRARDAGVGGQTMHIMRDVLDKAVGRSERKHRKVIVVLAALLVATAAFSFWRISALQHERRDIDEQILAIESQLEAGGLEDAELQALMDQLQDYQEQALRLQNSVFYKLGLEGREQAFVEQEIREVMGEFGAEQYSIPPEFIEQVGLYVERYRGKDRGVVDRSIGSHREQFEQMKTIFAEMNLPPDLVAMVLVESSFLSQRRSSKGAAGLWQFTPATARAYGLRVDGEVDEREDLEKSTRAAGRYVRELILEFGAGSSVMLALAAYNGGPTKVKRAVRRVDDPIKQRNFWYLYRVRALPWETRQYVPKIIAAIIVGRNLDELGF